MVENMFEHTLEEIMMDRMSFENLQMGGERIPLSWEKMNWAVEEFRNKRCDERPEPENEKMH